MTLNSIHMFSSLPHLMKVDGEIREYDDSCTPEYIAYLSEYDGEWHIDWVSEEGDSIQNIAEEDINVAIQEAYQWCVNEGYIRDFNTPMNRLKDEIKGMTEKISELNKCMNDTLSESEEAIVRNLFEGMVEYRYQLKRWLSYINHHGL